ncbi:protein adenylyltransferase SelO [Ramlibacter sp. 2FC]|uniref:protein adenylyltransferase SelO n=1 Tax=Ramlibacter sp. 2FC TaxID=2502188 RepID=UPI001485B6A9|nr:YdiU family protein [Ramlibacter sp. 2FC]
MPVQAPQDIPSQADSGLHWRNRFAALGPAFYTRLMPQPLPAPHWVARSQAMARELGLAPEWLDSPAALAVFSGNQGLAGSEPLASVYSGHQFGVWAGQLGDGRAILLGELLTPDGRGLELQLKGSGRTPYSRMGDGRAVLRSSIREFLCSEAMHALGIPSSRALCVTGSPAPVRREEIETAAVVTRVAPSFIRFGHFEHFSYSGQHEQLRALADFVIDAFYPDCRAGSGFKGNAYAALLEAVSARTAAMVAQWQAVGFCHGVMNTDNMSILGLTIDYGPFQFLDGFDPGHICNHSDPQGRYAYHRQPNIAYWNLFCLGQALLPLIEEQELALAALEPYKAVFPRELDARMGAKLGLQDAAPQDRELTESILQLMAKERVDYTIFWRRLSRHVAGEPVDAVRDLFLDRAGFDDWLGRFRERSTGLASAEQSARMLAVNPKYVLRNHLGEVAIRAAKLGDFSEVERLLALLEHPFDEQPGMDAYAGFPPDWASSIAISCSS